VPITFRTGPVSVRTPATSANLGPGFDALGLALTLYDEVTAQVVSGATVVEVAGEGAGSLPSGEDHLVVQAMRTTFDLLGGQPEAVRLRCVNRIPQARGLGSSSAAIVAGVMLAQALVDGASEGRTGREAALEIAGELEGHPDNAAPCILGGFTIAWLDGDHRARAAKLTPHPGVSPTVYVPQTHGFTAAARHALPKEVPHADASFNAGRSALLVHALTAEPSLLLEATEDRLHQDYRAAGMPETAALVKRLREHGIAAVVSGAGPTVLALEADDQGEMPDLGMDRGWVRHNLGFDLVGAALVE
jgi:homoserine kinase